MRNHNGLRLESRRFLDDDRTVVNPEMRNFWTEIQFKAGKWAFAEQKSFTQLQYHCLRAVILPDEARSIQNLVDSRIG